MRYLRYLWGGSRGRLICGGAAALLTVGGAFAAQEAKTEAMPHVQEKQPIQMPLFVGGTEGYHTFRIPSLIVTPRGTVLALCEGRKHGGGDSGDIDLVLRRSTDGGRTWGPLQVVWDDGANTCGNPCPVVDASTGHIVLLMTHNLGEDHEAQITAGTSKGTRTPWVCESKDDGLTWSKPREITRDVKPANWTWYATGPGIGIQVARGVSKGRLVIPCNHMEAGTKRQWSHVIYSDDHGKTWRRGGDSPQERTNESQVAELRDGRLMLNMRSADRAHKERGVCISADGGVTWTDFRYDSTLIEPICQGSILSYSPANGAAPLLLFSNPADAQERKNMTVRVSRDSGATWETTASLHPGPAAYSCLTALPDGEAACLYEGGEVKPYESIIFARFALTAP